MIFPHFIVGVPSSADSQPMFGEKMREIPVTRYKYGKRNFRESVYVVNQIEICIVLY